MTQEEALTALHKHKVFFEHFEKTGSFPDVSSDLVQDIHNIYKALRPDFVLDSCCGNCVLNMLTDANRYRVNNLKFHKL